MTSQPVRDAESDASLALIQSQEAVRSRKISGVSKVLVVASSRGMVFDREALKTKIQATYGPIEIYFMTPLGIPLGEKVRNGKVDLILDFIGPRQKRKWFLSRKLRRMGKHVFGRDVGLFRAKIYDWVVENESSAPELWARERHAQVAILEHAGVPIKQASELMSDLSHSIALDLPPRAKQRVRAS